VFATQQAEKDDHVPRFNGCFPGDFKFSHLLILVFPLGGNDRLDAPHRELRAGRNLIASALRPIPMTAELSKF